MIERSATEATAVKDAAWQRCRALLDQARAGRDGAVNLIEQNYALAVSRAYAVYRDEVAAADLGRKPTASMVESTP